LTAEHYYKLGKQFEKGPKADAEKSFENFLKAAEMGHSKSQLRVAYCYDIGTGVKQDAVLAAKWYLAAAETEPKAQFSLGLCYAKGLGVARDDKEAVKWFKQAADSGYERALYNLGYCYEMGTGVDRDTDKALEYYQQAASKGSDLAKKRLQLYGVTQA
jgi:TPR repeat protein